MKKIYFLLFVIYVSSSSFLYSQISVNINVNNPICFGNSDGNISIEVFGGTEPYSINWSNNSGIIDVDTNYVDSLLAGKYWFDITDSTGLFFTDTVYLTSSQISTIDVIIDAPCYASNGSLKITPQGGKEFYLGIWRRMIWNPSLNTMILDISWSDTSLTNIDTNYFAKSYPRGFYILTVIDSSGLGCSITKTIEIKEPSAPVSVQEMHIHNKCKYDSTAMISAQAYGGTFPYTYLWSSGKTTAIINNLLAGIYTLTVTDSKGCAIRESVDIEEPFQELIIISEKFDVSCRDNQDGSISILQIENSIAPYTYKWSTNETGISINNLLADQYILTVTDANNCFAIDTFDVKLNDFDCITINNVITPDGNGKNDFWIIDNIHLYPECNVSVFDRWGNQVFSKTGGYDNMWNADYNGNPLNSGDYYYIVNLNRSNYKIYSGPLKIIK